MSYIGDFRLGDTFDTKFTTVSTTGAPTTLAGTPVISAYVGNSTTEITAGITLTVDFDARTGMHNVRVVASSGNGFATASNYQLVITTGTVGGTSVVGYVIGEFSIEARSAVMPTTAARTLDVSTTGEAGIDWANIGSPTTSQTLSGTTVGTATAVTTVNGLAANVITAAATATDFGTEVATAVWDTDATTHQTQGTFGQAIGDPVADTNTIYKAVVTDAAGATVGIDVVAVKADTAAILIDTTEIGVAGAGLTAIDLPNQTMDIVGNITGSLSGSVGSVTGAVGSVTGSVGSIAAGGIAATSFAAGAIDAASIASDTVTEIRSIVSGTADSGSTTTMVDAARTEADTDYWKDMAILFTSGTISGQTRLITAFNPTTDTITFSPATTQAVTTNTYEIITNVAAAGASAPTAAEVADAVWDEDATAHQTTGTFGQAIGDPVADTNTIYGAVVTGAAGATIAVDIISVQADTDNIQTRLPAALVSGRMDSSVGAMAADTLTASALAADAATEIANAVLDTDMTAHQIQGSLGQAIGDPVADTNTIYKAVVTDATGATVGIDVVAIKAETSSIQTDTNDIQTTLGVAGAGLTAIDLPDQTMNITGNITGNLSGSVGSVTGGVTVSTNNDKTGYALTSGERDSIADTFLDRNMSTGADSGTGIIRTPRQALRFLRNKWTLSGTALTVFKEDDVTSSWASTVTTTPAADPVTASDPAGP